MVDSDDKDSKEGKATTILTETMKKVFTAGVSAAFMTEESVRAYLSELKLPKEILNILLQSAAKSKEEIQSKVTNEIVSIIQKIDFVKEAARFAEDHKFKITAEVEILKKDKKT
jgi:hypothetical protein